MRIAAWNTVSWDIGPPWDGAEGASPSPPPPPPLPTSPPLRLRECIRRVGVHNVTLKKETVLVNQESRNFFEYGGVSGMDKVHPQDIHCKNFKIKTLPGD